MSEFSTKFSAPSLVKANNKSFIDITHTIQQIPTTNLKSIQNHNKPPHYKSAESYNNEETISDSDLNKNFFHNVQTSLKAHTKIISNLSNDLDKILSKKPIDKGAVKIIYAKIISLQNNLHASLNSIYKDSKINEALCNSICDKEMQNVDYLTSSTINKCSKFIDVKNQTDYDENKIIIELDKDIDSHKQPIQDLLNNLNLHNKELPQEAREFSSHAEFLLQNPPNIHLSEYSNDEEKTKYMKVKLEYALKLKDVYEGLSKLKDLNLNNKSLNPDEFNIEVKQICQTSLLEHKTRSNLHIIRNQSDKMKGLDSSSPQYKQYLSQAILHNINLKKSYDTRYGMHFWRQIDKQSCVFASMCNAKQFANIGELNKYLNTQFDAKTLETWLLEILDNKIGVSLANGLEGEYLDNSDASSKLSDTNIIGMYKHDEINNLHSGHVISIKKQDNNLYLMDSGANSIQKFNDYNTMLNSLNNQYGARFDIGNNNDNYSTVSFKV